MTTISDALREINANRDSELLKHLIMKVESETTNTEKRIEVIKAISDLKSEDSYRYLFSNISKKVQSDATGGVKAQIYIYAHCIALNKNEVTEKMMSDLLAESLSDEHLYTIKIIFDKWYKKELNELLNNDKTILNNINKISQIVVEID